MPYKKHNLNKYWNIEFMLKIKPIIKCVGLMDNSECPSNLNPIGFLQQDFDHFKGVKVQAIAHAQHKMSLDNLYKELLKTRVLCVAHHRARKGEVKRDRRENLIKPMLSENGIKLTIPIRNNDVHKLNMEIIKRWFIHFKNKPIPIIAKVGSSNGIPITDSLITKGIKLRTEGLGSNRIAKQLHINVNAVKRFIPLVKN